MAVELRAVGADEIEAMELADTRGFGNSGPPPGPDRTWTEGELDRTRVAFDDGQVVGLSRAYSFELTLPGGAIVPAAAVSWVSVIPTHRRRGILTKMIDALHDDARDRGEPAAILTASESHIYGRFGYGIATWRLGMSTERARARFARPVDDGGRVRFMTRTEAEQALPKVYDCVRRARAGMVSRPAHWWPQVFWGQIGGTDKAFFVVVHEDASGVADGYAAYEITGDWNRGLVDRRLLVWDLQTTNADARAALWQYLFGVDLVGTVAATNLPIDEPLRWLVTDGRRVRTDFVNDGLWLAPLDPAALLGARRYAIEGRVVLEVHQPDGSVVTLAVDGGPAAAQCAPTSAAPDIVCATSALGACLLGGNRWTQLAPAGLVEERTHGALERADLMFVSTPTPAMTTGF